MHTLNQWLEGKKKEVKEPEEPEGMYRGLQALLKKTDESYNQALTDLQDSLPTLLSTMEAEIGERIGGDEKEYMNDMEFMKQGRNQERSRIHTIIHSYFKTQV